MTPEEIPDAAVEAFLTGEGVYRRESYRTGCWVAADGFRAGLAAALPHLPVPAERQREIEAKALRAAADEVERDGGVVLTATWAADALRERADQITLYGEPCNTCRTAWRAAGDGRAARPPIDAHHPPTSPA